MRRVELVLEKGPIDAFDLGYERLPPGRVVCFFAEVLGFKIFQVFTRQGIPNPRHRRSFRRCELRHAIRAPHGYNREVPIDGKDATRIT